jgi:SAM-dependent methyltransferase
VSRPAYIASNLAKNALVPIAWRLRPDRVALGMEGDPELVLKTLDWFVPGLRALGVESARDLDVLELGPGRTPDVMAAFVLAGARSAVGVDVTVEFLPPGWDSPAAYRPLVDALSGPAGAEFRAALGLTPEGLGERLGQLDGQPWPVRMESYDGEHIPLADSSVDLVLSKSVLEHVRPAQVRPLLAEMHRVLRPGGAMMHMVDLRDHMHIEGDETVHGDWLDALTYPEWLFRAMFSKRTTSINRLRSSEWKALVATDSWSIEQWEPMRFPLPHGFDKSRLESRWRGLPDDELGIGQIRFAARAPAGA